jgi:preprotein translocase subunit SecG
MLTMLVTLHVIICVLLVVTVLLQFGKGAEMGAVMGGGASQAVFSSSAKGNFLTKLTTVLAIGFMLNSIVLTTIKSRESKKSLFDNEAPVAAPLNSDVQALDKKVDPAAGDAAPATTPTTTAPAATNTTAPAESAPQ